MFNLLDKDLQSASHRRERKNTLKKSSTENEKDNTKEQKWGKNQFQTEVLVCQVLS